MFWLFFHGFILRTYLPRKSLTIRVIASVLTINHRSVRHEITKTLSRLKQARAKYIFVEEAGFILIHPSSSFAPSVRMKTAFDDDTYFRIGIEAALYSKEESSLFHPFSKYENIEGRKQPYSCSLT